VQFAVAFLGMDIRLGRGAIERFRLFRERSMGKSWGVAMLSLLPALLLSGCGQEVATQTPAPTSPHERMILELERTGAGGGGGGM
jgi:hypothetical protein